ncbi:hypothetical protein CS0771_21840 [Catellatospora sp. IY07-71]|uniref:hypothetical protein n=1 Tax=Catellatospora sp. IY07-71 TaxID=2728827 RepID=UPI001BB3C610|nr:hypothetical protein [Catellatospora sp. IY07-71]BCJ72640.1 hypothetical protein CS0771_21840 [Catellatospora sp. IY07-71]
MSLVQELADQLRVAREELPLPQVSAAAERLRTATGLLAWVLHHSAVPVSVPDLSRAVERLDHAAAALRVAQDRLDEYALALGMPVDAHGRADESWPAALPAQPARGEVTGSADCRLADWWGERVTLVTGEEFSAAALSGDRADAAQSSAELLRRCVSAAHDGDRRRLHRHLAAAGPAVGLGLSAVAPALLRQLATDLVGYPPRLEDLARVRRAALPLPAELLPQLPTEAAEEIVARICHTRPQRAADRSPVHPVDSATAAALLVAALLRANGRTADELAQVIEAERAAAGAAQQRAAERAEVNRAALRITDSGRRRSAVDELGRVPRPAARRRSGG